MPHSSACNAAGMYTAAYHCYARTQEVPTGMKLGALHVVDASDASHAVIDLLYKEAEKASTFAQLQFEAEHCRSN